jgi:cap2 methyltransferase
MEVSDEVPKNSNKADANNRMLVYDISNVQGVWKLPPINRWLAPHYSGIQSELLGWDSQAGISLTPPRNWKKDFPDYVYDYPEMMEIKAQLNRVKQKQDPISADPRLRDKYLRIADMVRAHDDLRGKNGILVKRYGAEIVTNAWLKMYELMNFLQPQLAKCKKPFHSFHIAEAPGNFLLAINHKLRTDYSSVEWDWLANSYWDLYSSGNVHYLEDQYGLIRAFPDKWIFGADGDGDITSPANLRSFSQTVRERFPNGCQFMTSDVKYVPIDVNFDEEERINLPVHLGHLLCALLTLEKGGTMILKEFTLFEGPSVALVYLMSCCFKQVRIVKPETSRPANSEIYIVGLGYQKNLSQLQFEALYNIMEYIRYLNTDAGSPAIFLQSDVPKSFVDKLIRIESALAKLQMQFIERNLELFERYQEVPFSQIQRELAPIRERAAEEWIKKMGVKVLDSRHHLMVPQSSRRRVLNL